MTGWGIVAALAIWAACIVLVCQMLSVSGPDDYPDDTGSL